MILKRIIHAVNKIKSKSREIHKEHTRSSHWAKVRDNYLEENPLCAACGSGLDIQIHHKKPFHLHPELELDSKNLISLCMDKNECHLKLGHGGSFKSFNPNVEEDAKKFRIISEKERIILIECIKRNRQN